MKFCLKNGGTCFADSSAAADVAGKLKMPF